MAALASSPFHKSPPTPSTSRCSSSPPSNPRQSPIFTVKSANRFILAASAAGFSEIPGFSSAAGELTLREPDNALSLPTWAIHVSSAVEWITPVAWVLQYGEKTGYATWKGLSWGTVPSLGAVLRACTWHFFYNAVSLDLVLVALQAALTVLGNFTMCIAAFCICKSTLENSENL